MGFDRLRYVNFRNLRDGELDIAAREVFLVGQNGQGKTNLLEAVHLLSLGSSFREKLDSALARDPLAVTALFGRYVSADSGETTLGIRFAAGKRKELRLNDKPLEERRDLLSAVLCVCFVQQDMDFVTGPAEDRRRFFDQTLVLSDLSFIDTLRGYRQVLRSRNLCLKQGREDLLDVYDGQLASFGLTLQERRADLVKEFEAVFSPLYCQITGIEPPGVGIRYKPSWQGLGTTELIMEHLAAQRQRDRLLGTTASGPHRDSCTYAIGGRDFSHYASTGQLRLCALTLRVAQARFLSDRTGRRPVLLLDDVLLELDPARRKAFLDRLPGYEQAFFTFLPDEAWQSYRTADTMVLGVEAGEIRG
jgi:DNA replication and repair protein RecF